MSSRWLVIVLTLLAVVLNFFPGLAIATWGFHIWPRWDAFVLSWGFVRTTPYLAALLLLAMRWLRAGLILALATSTILAVLNSRLLLIYWMNPSSEKLLWRMYPASVIAVNAGLCVAAFIEYRRLPAGHS